MLLVLCLAGCERRQHLVEQHLLEFGTLIQITLVTDDLRQAEDLLHEIEGRLKTYRGQWHAWQDSDLTRFNQALQQGDSVTIPDSLKQLLGLSQSYYADSDGLFNPALGKLIAAHGFHQGDSNSSLIDAIKRDLPDMRDLQIDGSQARSLNPHLQIDLGGIAKGFAIGLIAEYLDQNRIEHYVINAGGDLMTAGNRLGRAWRIGVQNPYAPGVIASIELQGRHSLFTSGNYRRKYQRGEQLNHHIIDPRSGDSSRGQSSATVLSQDPVRADVAATALMIDGMRGGSSLAAKLGVDQFMIVSDQREILISPALADKLEIHSNWPVIVLTNTPLNAGDNAAILAQ